MKERKSRVSRFNVLRFNDYKHYGASEHNYNNLVFTACLLFLHVEPKLFYVEHYFKIGFNLGTSFANYS